MSRAETASPELLSAMDSDQFFIRIIPFSLFLSLCLPSFLFPFRYVSIGITIPIESRRARFANRFQSILIPLLIIDRIHPTRFIRRYKKLVITGDYVYTMGSHSPRIPARKIMIQQTILLAGNVFSFLFHFLPSSFFCPVAVHRLSLFSDVVRRHSRALRCDV